MAFQETDGDRFFGREEQVAALWQKLRQLHETEAAIRVLPIYGPSGSGKSSLARAGLIPELAKHPIPGYDRARVAVLVPGTHPLEALATVLARIATNDPIPVTKTREFATELAQKSQTNEYDGLRRIADVLPDITLSPLIVLVDQFEEVYTLCKAQDERDAFVANLLCAAGDRAKRVMVTDHNDEVLRLLERNVEHAVSHRDRLHIAASFDVRKIEWGPLSAETAQWARDVDVVFGSDIVYSTVAVSALLSTVKDLLGLPVGDSNQSFSANSDTTLLQNALRSSRKRVPKRVFVLSYISRWATVDAALNEGLKAPYFDVEEVSLLDFMPISCNLTAATAAAGDDDDRKGAQPSCTDASVKHGSDAPRAGSATLPESVQDQQSDAAGSVLKTGRLLLISLRD